MLRRRTKKHEPNPWFARLREFVDEDFERRGEPPELSEGDILAWADSYHARTNEWPNAGSGKIPEASGETWLAVEAALSMGLRGLEGRLTLARFLAEHRGRYNLHDASPITSEDILAWADDWHAETGDWPSQTSGAIPSMGGMTWAGIDQALRQGRRGLPAGSSLARLLEERRGVRNRASLPALTEEQIVGWADAHRRRTGRWPNNRSGTIPEAPGENWSAVEAALFQGVRGLPGGSTLARLLAKHRGKYNPRAGRRLTFKQILAWSDAWKARTGRWPIAEDGPIPEAPETTWMSIDNALRSGRFGLRGGSSLARLLEAKRNVCNRGGRPPYTVEQILAWADAHKRRTGSWPTASSGQIKGERFESWNKVDLALRYGKRGMAGGSSLGRLLAQSRGVAENVRPALNTETILTWADAHYKRTGTWPGQSSGAIADAAGETWSAVNAALMIGRRGLPGGTTLAKLLLKHRGVRIRKHPPKLRLKQILTWADKHHARTGKWPTVSSGPIVEAPGETWRSIYNALYHGERGLPRGLSLARLLEQERGVRNVSTLPALNVHDIVRWAKAHKRRTGRWPTRNSGELDDAPGETWAAVDRALHYGYRGLTGGTTLKRFVSERCLVVVTR